MNLAGFSNVLEGSSDRYPEVSEKDIQDLNPEYILLSSEPFPFKESHKTEMEALFPQSQVLLVDGEMFSWSPTFVCARPPVLIASALIHGAADGDPSVMYTRFPKATG